ncbi:hypothetical protein PVAP13_3NG079677 [Panicum virgatum]|uniref:Uncharacterized protein n=1 Tax=Panicum virgatum TaxID=38727 RepID=A0A8T0U6V7_PANVG|nr:hypothetical protein PVAP13_3NG079677 [Panicum virgatum]
MCVCVACLRVTLLGQVRRNHEFVMLVQLGEYCSLAFQRAFQGCIACTIRVAILVAAGRPSLLLGLGICSARTREDGWSCRTYPPINKFALPKHFLNPELKQKTMMPPKYELKVK